MTSGTSLNLQHKHVYFIHWLAFYYTFLLLDYMTSFLSTHSLPSPILHLFAFPFCSFPLHFPPSFSCLLLLPQNLFLFPLSFFHCLLSFYYPFPIGHDGNSISDIYFVSVEVYKLRTSSSTFNETIGDIILLLQIVLRKCVSVSCAPFLLAVCNQCLVC